ncbi:MAG: septum formation initiator family protein [Candidatus Omnitrophica bacterium]|nr:septum formation initiator family protein [Candidatus Omnitrophota bacterium]
MVPVVKRAFWIAGFAVFLLGIFLPGYTKLQELRDKNRDLTVKIKQLKIDNSLLEQELKRVENDPVYQEKMAREKMGVVRKGEIPVRIVPEKRR